MVRRLAKCYICEYIGIDMAHQALFVLAALVAVTSAQLLAGRHLAVAPADEYDPNPSYSFSYDVQDPVTGDVKGQTESRQGDSVQGSYTLIEADGSRRLVEYNADPLNGFNAVVHKVAPGAPAVARVAPVAVGRAPITTIIH